MISAKSGLWILFCKKKASLRRKSMPIFRSMQELRTIFWIKFTCQRTLSLLRKLPARIMKSMTERDTTEGLRVKKLRLADGFWLLRMFLTQ